MITAGLRDRRDALVTMRRRHNALIGRGEVLPHLQVSAEQLFAEQSTQIDRALGVAPTTLDELKWEILLGADRKELAKIKAGWTRRIPTTSKRPGFPSR